MPITGASLALFAASALTGFTQSPAPAPAASTLEAASPSADAAEVSGAVLLPEVKIIGIALPSPQQSPVSATLLTTEDVENFRLSKPQDIVKLAPNVSATDSGSRSFGDVYSTRGLTNTVFFGAPSTTVYVDDVPFGETFTYAQDIMAINSVEVLRGPQPTLVGRNTYGGLINVRSRRPTNALEGAVNYAYGSYEMHDLDGWLMGNLVPDTLGFRLGGMYDTRQGYLTNPSTGETVDDQEHWGLNGGIFINPAPGWEIAFLGGYDEYEDGGPRLTSLDRRTGFYTVSSDVIGRQERRSDHEALRVAFENDHIRFLSVTSRRSFDLDPYTIDLDFTPEPFGYSTITQSQEIWSQEFRLSSNDPDAVLQWNAGVYGSSSRIKGTGLRGFGFSESRVDHTVTNFIQPIPTFFGTLMVPLTARSVSYSDTDVALEQLTVHSIEEESFAAYGGVSYEIAKPVTVNLGARIDRVERSLQRDKYTNGQAVTETTTHTTIDPVTGFPPFPAPPVDFRTTITPINEQVQRIELEDEWVHFTPSAGIDVEISDHVLAYAKTAYAFKPGGFSAYADDVAYVPFKEERVWATEVGVKTDWLDSRLQANLAGFYNSVENYQVERSFTVTDYAVFNAENAEIYGLEFETRYEICSYLDFLGSIGWTHARLTDYTDPVTGRSLNGVTAPFVPEFDAVAALDFHLECGFFARVEYFAVGNTKFDDFNRDEFQQDGYGLLGAAVGWRAKNWSLSLYGSNLTQEEYYTMMNPEIRTGAVGIPREFGVRLGVNF